MAQVKPIRDWPLKKLSDGYSAMAKDETREREAEEWSDGMIGDVFAQE